MAYLTDIGLDRVIIQRLAAGRIDAMIQPNQSEPEQSIANEPASQKMRLVLGMQRSGIRMMKQNLIRRHPDESVEQINHRLTQWLAQTPDTDDPRFEIRRCKTRSKHT